MNEDSAAPKCDRSVVYNGVLYPSIESAVSCNPELLTEIITENARLKAEALSAKLGRQEDVALVPRKLTAENGAKAHLMGEFETIDRHGNAIVVSWTSIKEIYAAAINFFDGANQNDQ